MIFCFSSVSSVSVAVPFGHSYYITHQKIWIFWCYGGRKNRRKSLLPTEDLWVIFLDTDCKINAHPPTKPPPTTSQTCNNPNPLFHNQIPQQNPTQFPLFHNTFPQLKNKSNSKSKSYLRNRFQKSKLHLPIRKSHLPYPNEFFCLNLQIIYQILTSHSKPINLKSPRKFRPNQSDSLKITQYSHIKQYLRANNKHILLRPPGTFKLHSGGD